MKDNFVKSESKEPTNKPCPTAPSAPSAPQTEEMVTPFSNGTESMIFRSENCDMCKLYESESRSENQATCKLAYNLDVGELLGEIPLWVAKEIGCTNSGHSVLLNRKCSKIQPL